jgi:hypothetical protein
MTTGIKVRVQVMSTNESRSTLLKGPGYTLESVSG